MKNILPDGGQTRYSSVLFGKKLSWMYTVDIPPPVTTNALPRTVVAVCECPLTVQDVSWCRRGSRPPVASCRFGEHFPGGAKPVVWLSMA